MDSFTLSAWYLLISIAAMLFKSGIPFGLLLTVVFLWWTVFKRENWDDSIAPYISVIIYIVVLLIFGIWNNGFWLTVLIIIISLIYFPVALFLMYFLLSGLFGDMILSFLFRNKDDQMIEEKQRWGNFVNVIKAFFKKIFKK